MKGDFSRLTFDRKKHYSDVLMQQGRVLVDADWNEQQRISRYRMETETADVTGPSGVPATGGLDILTSSFARNISVIKEAKTNTLLGWIVGTKAAILHWDGKAFNSQTAPKGITATLRSVCFVNEKHGWAAGDNGTMLYTANGGTEWISQKTGAESHLLFVYFMKPKSGREYIGCAVGTKGTLLFTPDSGKNWFRQETKTKVQLNAAHILPLAGNKGYKIFAVGNSRTILEYGWNGKGDKLTPVAPIINTLRTEKPDLFSVNSVVNGKNELAVAAGEGGVLFCKTGEAWQSATSGVSVTLKAVLVMRGADTSFGQFPLVLAAIGEDGAIVFSTDAEAWWVFQTKLSEKVTAVNFIDANREQAASVMTLLGNKGGVFNQAATGWTRFAGLINSLSTSAGRIYTDGILCEFEEAAPLPMPTQAGKHLVYLDCWRRHITAAQDPQIREKALCGPDTCTRTQTIAQVKYLPVMSAGTMEKVENLRASAREIVHSIKTGLQTRTLLADAEIMTAAAMEMEKLVNLTDEEVTIHAGRDSREIMDFVTAQKKKLGASALEKVKDKLDTWQKVQTDIVEILVGASMEKAWKKLTTAPSCALSASVKKSDTQQTACSISAGGGYVGLENQLYRVEIHAGSESKTGPTFKWSRDNGSVIFPFEIVSNNDTTTIIRLTTRDLGSYYPVSKEEWIGAYVEVIKDDDELAGMPGILFQVTDVPSDTEMILKGSLNKNLWSNKSQHPVIRRWDQRDDAKKSGAVAVEEDQWLDLESGVQIRFEKDGTYKTGDYWIVPARTDAADVEWPQSGGEPAALPPNGIKHHYAQLAALAACDTGKGTMIVTEIHDCRAVFEPLADTALHVTGINWLNNSTVAFNEAFYVNLLNIGFQMVLDDAPDPWTVNSSSVIVTAQFANGLTIPVPGNIQAQGNVISWRGKATTKKAQANTTHMNVMVDSSILHNSAISNIAGSSASAGTTAQAAVSYRVRITLKGGLIWRTCSGRRIYLDGQVFGKPRNEKDEEGNIVIRYDLILPSGAGRRGSDFESWMDIVQPEKKTSPARSQNPTGKYKQTVKKNKK